MPHRFLGSHFVGLNCTGWRRRYIPAFVRLLSVRQHKRCKRRKLMSTAVVACQRSLMRVHWHIAATRDRTFIPRARAGIVAHVSSSSGRQGRGRWHMREGLFP